MDTKDLIVKVVEDHIGIKDIELVVEVTKQSAETPFNIDAYERALRELVDDGDIREIEYIIPSDDYRVHRWYIPRDTVVVLSKAS